MHACASNPYDIYSGEYLLTTAWTKDLGPSVASALTTLAEGFDGELGNTILSITVFFPVRDRCQLVEKI